MNLRNLQIGSLENNAFADILQSTYSCLFFLPFKDFQKATMWFFLLVATIQPNLVLLSVGDGYAPQFHHIWLAHHLSFFGPRRANVPHVKQQ